MREPFILAYNVPYHSTQRSCCVLHGKHVGGGENDDVSFSKIEDMVRSFKAHRCAQDFDFSFIEAELRR